MISVSNAPAVLLKQMRDTQLFVELVTELLSRGQPVRFQAGGRSMHPAIQDGDYLLVEPVSAETVRCGDVLLYLQHGRPLVHRVVEIRREGSDIRELVLQGDALPGADAPVGPEQILGRVVQCRPNRKLRAWRFVRQILRRAGIRRTGKPAGTRIEK